MVHAYAAHSLEGHSHYVKKCTCGNEKFILKTNGLNQDMPIGEQEFCEHCGTPLMSEHANTLTFASMPQVRAVGRFKTNSTKACYFEFELYDLNFYTNIDFQKKTIKIDKRKIKNNMVKVVFDASQKPEDFIKYYNKDQKEIDRYTFEKLLVKNKTYSINNKSYLTDKFYMIKPFMDFSMSANKIILMINFLEKQKDFFIQYEQVIKSGIDPYPIRQEIDLTKTNPTEMLGVRPFTFKYIRSLKNGITLGTLKAIKQMEEKIGDQAVYYLQTFGKDPEGLQTNFMNTILDLVCEADLSVSKLFKYIYKEVPMKQYIIDPSETITLLRDSFEMSKQLGLVFNKNSKTLRRYHDELVEEYKTVEDELLAKAFSRSMSKKEYLAYTEKDSKYCIVVPKESQELVKEGQELRHCVGSYIKRVASGTSFIVFLRYKEAPEKSFTTIEINQEDKIVQIRKKHNADLVEKDAKEFLINWADINGLDISWLIR